MTRHVPLKPAVSLLAILLAVMPAIGQTPGARSRERRVTQPKTDVESTPAAGDDRAVEIGASEAPSDSAGASDETNAQGDAASGDLPEAALDSSEPAQSETPEVQSPLAPVGATPDDAPHTATGELPRRPRLGLELGRDDRGLVVLALAENSPASLAGLRVGDRLTAIDGAPVRDGKAFHDVYSRMKARSAAKIAVERDGESLELELVPDELSFPRPEGTKVEYRSFAGREGRLRSVWTMPARDAETPRAAVLIVRGVGAPAADAPGPDAMRELANRVAASGMLAIRYDAAGVGDSEGPANATVDFDGEIADAKAALAHVRADSHVDPSRVFLVGQGTGGGVAAVVASGDPEVPGVAVLGTIARPVMEYLLESRRQQLTLARVAPGDAAEIMRQHVAVFARVLTSDGAPEPDPYGIVGPNGTVMGKQPGFWRQYDRAGLAKVFAELKRPVLNAIGEFDFVSTAADHRVIADALKAGGADGPYMVILEGADHDLLRYDSRDAAFASYATGGAPVNTRAVSTIAEWLVTQARRESASL